MIQIPHLWMSDGMALVNNSIRFQSLVWSFVLERLLNLLQHLTLLLGVNDSWLHR